MPAATRTRTALYTSTARKLNRLANTVTAENMSAVSAKARPLRAIVEALDAAYNFQPAHMASIALIEEDLGRDLTDIERAAATEEIANAKADKVKMDAANTAFHDLITAENVALAGMHRAARRAHAWV